MTLEVGSVLREMCQSSWILVVIRVEENTDLGGYKQLVSNSARLRPFANEHFRRFILTMKNARVSALHFLDISPLNDLLIIRSIDEVSTIIEIRIKEFEARFSIHTSHS